MKRRFLELNLSFFCVLVLSGCPSLTTITTTSEPNSTNKDQPPSPVLLFEGKNVSPATASWPDSNQSGSEGGLSVFPGTGNAGPSLLPSGNSIPGVATVGRFNNLPVAQFSNNCMRSNAGSKFPVNSDHTVVMVIRLGDSNNQYMFADGANYGIGDGANTLAGNDATYAYYSGDFSNGSTDVLPSSITSRLPSTMNYYKDAPGLTRFWMANYYSMATNITQARQLAPFTSAPNGTIQAGVTVGPNAEPKAWGEVVMTKHAFDPTNYYTLEYVYHRNLDGSGNLVSADYSLFVNGVNETALPYKICSTQTSCTPLTTSSTSLNPQTAQNCPPPTQNCTSSQTCVKYIDTFVNDQNGIPTNTPITSVNLVPLTMTSLGPTATCSTENALGKSILTWKNASVGTVEMHHSLFDVGCHGGNPNGAQYLRSPGQIAEIQVYNAVLSDAQRTTIENNLRTKYGHY